jgi:hypothetical protein
MGPLEWVFAAAVLLVVAMGAIAIGLVLLRARGAIAQVHVQRAAVTSHVEESLALQREGIALGRESLAAQQETNRLLAEIAAKLGPARPG